MTVSDFVCYVLQVPANLDGFILTTKAIQYVLSNDNDSRFYEHLQGASGKSYACIEKALRLAKNKALERMSKDDYDRIYQGQEVKTKQFICYAAQYYRKEFGDEEQRT